MKKYITIGLFLVVMSGLGIGLYNRLVDPTPPPANPNSDRVAFLTRASYPELVSLFRQNTFITVMNVNSPGLTRIFQAKGIVWKFDWSPDGDYIVYFDTDNNLYRIAVDSSDPPELLSAKAFGREPAWSPDGSQIAYHSLEGIHLFSLTSKEISAISNTRSSDSPDWSPDGRQITFTYNHLGAIDRPPSSIAIINVDGTGFVQLTPDDGSSAPKWSPDGRKIAFHREANIYVMNSDGSHTKALTTDGESVFPDWSADGTKIVFLSSVNRVCEEPIIEFVFCTNEVRIMDRDGANIQILRNEGNERYGSPVWAPGND